VGSVGSVGGRGYLAELGVVAGGDGGHGGDVLLHQPLLRHHGGAGAGAHRGGELTVDLVADVAGGEDPGHAGVDLVAHVDVAAGQQVDEALQILGVGDMP